MYLYVTRQQYRWVKRVLKAADKNYHVKNFLKNKRFTIEVHHAMLIANIRDDHPTNKTYEETLEMASHILRNNLKMRVRE